MPNPFQYGAELKVGQIVNRRTEIADATRAINEHGRLFLIGPRRFGKTAILRAATASAQQTGAIVVFLDAEAYPAMGALVRTLVTESARLLRSDAARTGEKIMRFFARLRPVISYNPLDETWSGSIHAESDPQASPIPMFVEALDGIARLAADADKPVAIVIDEFHKVVQWAGEGAEAQIRAAVQRHPDVGFVFSGSKTTLLNDMTLSPSRPFYRMGIRHFLGPLPREEFAAFIARGFVNAGHRADPRAVQDILDLSEDVPYNVQALSSVAWEQLREHGDTPLTPHRVRQALALLVARDSPFYVSLWNGLTSVQQRVLSAAVRERGMALTSGAVTRRYGVSASTISKTLRFLEDREILRREERQDSVRWRLEDPFLAAWLPN